MSVQIIRPVTVKAKVTEALKARLAAEVQEATQQLDAEVQQLDAQAKRAVLTLERITPQQQMQFRQAVEMEKQKRQAEKQELLERAKQISDLPLGSEIIQGTIQVTATVHVGDDWEKLMATEIVVQDGKVVQIREG